MSKWDDKRSYFSSIIIILMHCLCIYNSLDFFYYCQNNACEIVNIVYTSNIYIRKFICVLPSFNKNSVAITILHQRQEKMTNILVFSLHNNYFSFIENSYFHTS